MKKNNPGKEFKVTADGSLGLLALGAVGIKLWREAVEKQKLDKKSKKTDGKGKS